MRVYQKYPLLPPIPVAYLYPYIHMAEKFSKIPPPPWKFWSFPLPAYIHIKMFICFLCFHPDLSQKLFAQSHSLALHSGHSERFRQWLVVRDEDEPQPNDRRDGQEG